MNDFELPLYSSDIEKASGIPENAIKFLELIQSADGIVLSLAEHNGIFSAAFKNIFDWMSRIDKNVWQNKPMLLMAASPGSRGGANVLRTTKELLPRYGGNIVADFSLPSFYENFSQDGLKNKVLNDSLNQKILRLQEAIVFLQEIQIK
jgi:NAD(P)H-dependent FMN reductase